MSVVNCIQTYRSLKGDLKYEKIFSVMGDYTISEPSAISLQIHSCFDWFTDDRGFIPTSVKIFNKTIKILNLLNFLFVTYTHGRHIDFKLNFENLKEQFPPYISKEFMPLVLVDIKRLLFHEVKCKSKIKE